jgi:hypothetical protein
MVCQDPTPALRASTNSTATPNEADACHLIGQIKPEQERRPGLILATTALTSNLIRPAHRGQVEPTSVAADNRSPPMPMSKVDLYAAIRRGLPRGDVRPDDRAAVQGQPPHSVRAALTSAWPQPLGRRRPRTTKRRPIPGRQTGQQRHHLRNQQHRTALARRHNRRHGPSLPPPDRRLDPPHQP